MSHMSASKGRASGANGATPVIRGCGEELGGYHDGFFDSLATNTVKV